MKLEKVNNCVPHFQSLCKCCVMSFYGIPLGRSSGVHLCIFMLLFKLLLTNDSFVVTL